MRRARWNRAIGKITKPSCALSPAGRARRGADLGQDGIEGGLLEIRIDAHEAQGAAAGDRAGVDLQARWRPGPSPTAAPPSVSTGD